MIDVASAQVEAVAHLEAHALGDDGQREQCWQCAPRQSTTFSNHFLALVEDAAMRCPWCDGTGCYLYEWGKFRSCGQCDGTGRKRNAA